MPVIIAMLISVVGIGPADAIDATGEVISVSTSSSGEQSNHGASLAVRSR